MKFISLLIASLIVGFLLYQQLGPSKNLEMPNTPTPDITKPKIPTAPKEVQKFKQDMNQYMDELSDKRKQQIDDVINQ